MIGDAEQTHWRCALVSLEGRLDKLRLPLEGKVAAP